MGGISGAGMTTALESYRPLFMVVTFGFLGLAFYVTYRPRRETAGTANRASGVQTVNRIMLWCVTVIAAIFLFVPQSVIGLVTYDEGFTADMRQSVVIVEGMTCPG